MKICGRCHIEKEDSGFRVRMRDRKYPYLNSICRKCEAEIALVYHREKRKDPYYKAKNAAKTRAYYAARREEHNAKQREKRKTPEYKAYMKAYRERRKDIIREQEVVTKKRYHEKNKNLVTDKYVICRLRQQGIDNATKDHIEIKRAEIIMARIKKKISGKEVGVMKKCTTCLQEKDRSCFYPIKGTNKVTPSCRKCNNRKCTEYREKIKNDKAKSI